MNMRNLYRFLLVAVLACCSLQARERIYGQCEQGGNFVTVQSYPSAQTVQESFPQCTIAVYLTGSGGVLATIYSDNNGTAMSNPFTANASGYWFFYADNGTYDAVLAGGGLTSPMTLSALTAFDITAGTFSPNATNTNGGYLHLKPITYPTTNCFDHWGNYDNQPAAVAGDSFGANDAIMWVSGSPLAGVNPPGCSTPFTVQTDFGLNLNTYILAMGGLATTSNAYNSIQSLDGGEYLRLGLTTDQGVYMQAHPNSSALNTPSSVCVMRGTDIATPDDAETGCYSALAYKGGSIFWYYNGTTSAWNSIDFANAGGIPGGPPHAVEFNNEGVFGGVAAMEWDSTNSQLIITTPTAGTAGLAIYGGYAETGSGYISNNCTTYNCFQSVNGAGALTGGMAAASFTALSYIDIGTNYGPPTHTLGDAYNQLGRIYYDTGANCVEAYTNTGWGCLGSGGGGGSPGGPGTNPYAVQFNNEGVFGGVAALEWNNSVNQLIITTPTSATAGLAINNGYASTAGGYISNNCTTYNCFQSVNGAGALTGGMAAASFTALSYIDSGTSSGPPSPTNGDTATQKGRMYYDTGNHCEEVYTDTGWTCLGSGGGGSVVAPYTQAVSGLSASISAATHGEGTLALASCFDNSTPRVAVACAYTRDSSGNLAFTFNPSFTGLVEVISGGGGSGGGGGTPGTPVNGVQYNGGGVLSATTNFVWDGAKLVITAASSSVAGLAVGAGFVQADGGLLATAGTCTSYNCVQAPGGGAAALSFTAVNYIQAGYHNGAPATTASDTFHAGAMYWDTGAHCLMVRNDAGTPTWGCVGSGGGGTPGTPVNGVQYNGGGVLSATTNFVWDGAKLVITAASSSVAGLAVGAGFVQADGGLLATAGTCTRYNCVQAPGGGAAALSFTAQNYVQTGNASIGSSSTPPTLTTSDTFHAGAMYFDTSTSGGGPCERVYNGTTWPCLNSGSTGGVTSLNTLSGSLSIAGSTNGITVSSLGSTITLLTPQGIATTSTPQFNGVIAAGSSPAFTSAASGGTIAFSTSSGTYRVLGNGSIWVNGSQVIDQVGNGSFGGLQAASVQSYGLIYTTGSVAKVESGSTGTAIAFDTSNGLFQVNGNGWMSLQNIQLNGAPGSGTGLNVAYNTQANSIQTVGGVTAATGTFSSAVAMNGGFTTQASSNSLLYIGTGSLYSRVVSTSAGISCTGVADGWTAVTSDDYVVVCLGGARYRAPLGSY